jgi:hypothetical protein
MGPIVLRPAGTCVAEKRLGDWHAMSVVNERKANEQGHDER